jgi:eukaryotic-like serine/threonine-protein kinase
VAELTSLSPGQVLDEKYRVIRLIGSGAMGAVYEAEHLRLGRRVAIKLLRFISHEALTRFEREARAAARVGSIHIVDVLDFGEIHTGQRYIVMEHLEGETLHGRLARRGGVMTSSELVPIAADMLDGLADAHHAGIVHRDLKPENVFLTRTRKDEGEVVKILDFGVSKVRDDRAPGGELTHTGALLGTPRFMAPEQACGLRDVDGRADIFSAGVIIFRCLGGRYPFEGDTIATLVQELLSRDPVKLIDLKSDIDPRLSEIVGRALARRAADRFQSAEEMRAELLAWLEERGYALSAAKRRIANPQTPQPAPAPAPEAPQTTIPVATEMADPAAFAAHFTMAGDETLATTELGLPQPGDLRGPTTITWIIAATAALALATLATVAMLSDERTDELTIAFSPIAAAAVESLESVKPPKPVPPPPPVPVAEPTILPPASASAPAPPVLTKGKPPIKPAPSGRVIRRELE